LQERRNELANQQRFKTDGNQIMAVLEAQMLFMTSSSTVVLHAFDFLFNIGDTGLHQRAGD